MEQPRPYDLESRDDGDGPGEAEPRDMRGRKKAAFVPVPGLVVAARRPEGMESWKSNR